MLMQVINFRFASVGDIISHPIKREREKMTVLCKDFDYYVKKMSYNGFKIKKSLEKRKECVTIKIGRTCFNFNEI